MLVPLNTQTPDAPPSHLTNRVWGGHCHCEYIFLEDQPYTVRWSWKCHCLFERPNTGPPTPPFTWQTGCHQAVIKTNSICLQNSFCWKDSPDFVPSRGQNNEKEVTFVIVVRYICKIRVISIDYIPFTLLHVDLTAWISRSHESVLSECYNTLWSEKKKILTSKSRLQPDSAHVQE